MSIYFGSFGGIKPHSDTHLIGGSDEITGELNPLIFGAISAQDILDARNKIGAVSESEAQSWINGFGHLFDKAAGLRSTYTLNFELLHQHDAEVSTQAYDPLTVKTITINTLFPDPSTIRIAVAIKASAGTTRAQIYRNDSAVGVTHGISSTIYTVVWDVLSFADGDALHLKIWNTTMGCDSYARDLRIFGEVVDLPLAEAVARNTVGLDVPFAATNS